MQDLLQLKTLLDSFGIGYKVKHYDETVAVRIREGYDKVNGYYRFYTDFVFDSSGKFINVEILE